MSTLVVCLGPHNFAHETLPLISWALALLNPRTWVQQKRGGGTQNTIVSDTAVPYLGVCYQPPAPKKQKVGCPFGFPSHQPQKGYPRKRRSAHIESTQNIFGGDSWCSFLPALACQMSISSGRQVKLATSMQELRGSIQNRILKPRLEEEDPCNK